MLSPSIIVLLVVSTLTQVAGALLIPATKGLTAPWPTIGMFLGYAIGLSLLARVVAAGVNLSVAVPLVATAFPLCSILFGVAFLGESASPLKILLLLSACGLVLIASYMR